MIVIFRYRYPNKDVYVGQFKHDLFHGVGRYEAASGMTHEGEYKLSLIFFFFFFYFFSRFVFREGKRHGNGTMTAANGSSFTGGYANDLMEGFGVYKYASGDMYKGMFRANKFEVFRTSHVFEPEFFCVKWFSYRAKAATILQTVPKLKVNSKTASLQEKDRRHLQQRRNKISK